MVDSDGDGSGSAVVTRFAYEDGNAWGDLTTSGSLTTRRIFAGGHDSLLARIGSSGNEDWYLGDVIGSVRDIVDYTGVLIDHGDFGTFGGNPTSETNPSNGDRYKYTSRELEAEAQIQYNRARYLQYGRWMTQDPIGFDAGDSNLYRYVFNAPTMRTDPVGHKPLYDEYNEKLAAVLRFGIRRAERGGELAKKARDATNTHFPGDKKLWNTEADAWRHCYWSALMRTDKVLQSRWEDTGNVVQPAKTWYDYAYLIGYEHEKHAATLKPPQPQIEFAMDMHNNNIGLDIGTRLGIGAKEEQIKKACDEALKQGKLRYIYSKDGTNDAKTGVLTKTNSKTPAGAYYYIPAIAIKRDAKDTRLEGWLFGLVVTNTYGVPLVGPQKAEALKEVPKEFPSVKEIQP